jgi:hypothetical protein
MRGTNLRRLLIGCAVLATAVSVTSRGWAAGPGMPEHPAMLGHTGMRRLGAHDRPGGMASRVALPLLVAPHDRTVAREPHRWDGSLDEPPLPDVAGRWSGRWSGLGVMARRTSTAQAEFIQTGRWGWGKITLADTLAADVPSIVSYRGALGVPVLFDVFQSAVLVKHEAGGSHLTAVFRIEGDRMIGMLRGHATLIVLARQR